jgi:acetyl esterase/lipase
MKKFIIKYNFILLILLGLILNSCSTRFHSKEENGARKIYNLKYGEEKRQNMDVFLPKTAEKQIPLVIIVHGGAWKFGYKERMIRIQKFLFLNNIPSININYRLLRNGILYTDQLEDISKAIEKSQELSTEWKIDPNDFILLGESSGAHLALLYGYRNPHKIKKIISLSGPTDFYSEKYRNSNYFRKTKGLFQQVVGANYENNEEAFKKASPIANVSAVPTLIFQGDRDFLVNKNQGLALDSVLTSKNIAHQLVYLKNSGHLPRRVKWKRDSLIFPVILSFIKQLN